MQTLTPIIDNLIENIQSPKIKNINLILDGGAFNGSYHHGSLIYHHALEKKHYITINKISGTSIGSLIGLLYIVNKLDMCFEGFEIMRNTFKNTGTFCEAEAWLNNLLNILPENTYELCNDKLYITYYDLARCKQHVVCRYKSNSHILKTINKSMFIPYIFNGGFAYKNKYIDGFYPFIFQKKENIKNVYINLQSFYKIKDIFNISHDKNSYRRILDAINDTHNFYLKQTPTTLCSYVEDWKILDKLRYNTRLGITICLQVFFIIIRGIYINIPIKYRTIILELKLYNLLLNISYRYYIYMVNRFLVS